MAKTALVQYFILQVKEEATANKCPSHTHTHTHIAISLSSHLLFISAPPQFPRGSWNI